MSISNAAHTLWSVHQTRSRVRFSSAVAATLSLCLLASPVLAELADADDVGSFVDLDDDLQETPGFDTEPKESEGSDWKFMLGLIGGFKPEYEGSEDYEAAAAPNYKIAWRDTIILQGKNLKLQYKGKNYRVGALVSKESGRDEDDNKNLKGLGDVDSGWSAGLFARYEILKRTNLVAEGRQEFAGGHGGFLLDTGLEVELPIAVKPWIRTYMGMTYASSDYMEEFFGISSKQAAASGKKKYDADAGIKNVTLSLSTGYDITENWVIGAIVRYDRLLGDAADSPIVKDGGSRNQFTGGVSVAYQF